MISIWIVGYLFRLFQHCLTRPTAKLRKASRCGKQLLLGPPPLCAEASPSSRQWPWEVLPCAPLEQHLGKGQQAKGTMMPMTHHYLSTERELVLPPPKKMLMNSKVHLHGDQPQLWQRTGFSLTALELDGVCSSNHFLNCSNSSWVPSSSHSSSSSGSSSTELDRLQAAMCWSMASCQGNMVQPKFSYSGVDGFGSYTLLQQYPVNIWSGFCLHTYILWSNPHPEWRDPG